MWKQREWKKALWVLVLINLDENNSAQSLELMLMKITGLKYSRLAYDLQRSALNCTHAYCDERAYLPSGRKVASSVITTCTCSWSPPEYIRTSCLYIYSSNCFWPTKWFFFSIQPSPLVFGWKVKIVHNATRHQATRETKTRVPWCRCHTRSVIYKKKKLFCTCNLECVTAA